MEDSNKLHEETLKIAKSLIDRDPALKDWVTEKFPELKESEDERIRKEIIEHLVKEVGLYPGEDRKEHRWLRWLEKQGQVKALTGEDERMKNAAIRACRYMIDNFENSTKQYEDAIAWLEKHGEQEQWGFVEPVSEEDMMYLMPDEQSSDKVEPKFKVGDKIIHKELGGDNPHKIIQVDMLDKKYRLEDGLVAHFSEEDDWELVEQKPAWSEEEVRNFQDIDSILFYDRRLPEDIRTRLRNWLKSLKEIMKGE